uniref:Uncharacterized protein n=1 Tax=Opuntia streptacantha TaxID=393608 RepID=A0A7C9DL20_OPUST
MHLPIPSLKLMPSDILPPTTANKTAPFRHVCLFGLLLARALIVSLYLFRTASISALLRGSLNTCFFLVILCSMPEVFHASYTLPSNSNEEKNITIPSGMTATRLQSKRPSSSIIFKELLDV